MTNTIFLLHHYVHSTKAKDYPTEKERIGTHFQNAQIAVLICWSDGREREESETDFPVLNQWAGRGINPF